MQSTTGLHVGILGTGLSALASAHFIQKSGHRATVIDTDQGHPRPGKTFSCRGARFDQFLQTISDRDSEVHALISELGIEAQLQWHAEHGRRFSWPIRWAPKIATCAGLAQQIESELRKRLAVDEMSKAIDLLEFDHCIEIRTNRGRWQFDSIIATVPIDEVEDIARGLIAQEFPVTRSRYRTLVNVVFISSTPLFRKYSTFVESCASTYTQVASTMDVESSLNAISLSGYSELAETDLRILALKFLCENFLEFQPSSVHEVRVFQSKECIPVCPLKSDNGAIPARVGESRLFLSSRELGYGLPVSMNSDLFLAKKAVCAFLECAPIFACGARQAAHAAGQGPQR